jgi:hypothetical protein
VLKPGTWHHIAGVYDGSEVRLYVDGSVVGLTQGSGKRKTNQLPLTIGADVNGQSEPMSFLKGRVDSLRLSKGPVYTQAKFTPERRLMHGADTLILTNMDRQLGTAVQGFDEGKATWLGRTTGTARITAERP